MTANGCEELVVERLSCRGALAGVVLQEGLDEAEEDVVAGVNGELELAHARDVCSRLLVWLVPVPQLASGSVKVLEGVSS